jgi:hypothetical protein
VLDVSPAPATNAIRRGAAGMPSPATYTRLASLQWPYGPGRRRVFAGSTTCPLPGSPRWAACFVCSSSTRDILTTLVCIPLSEMGTMRQQEPVHVSTLSAGDSPRPLRWTQCSTMLTADVYSTRELFWRREPRRPLRGTRRLPRIPLAGLLQTLRSTPSDHQTATRSA